jgi:hypothetical protein
MPKKRQQTPWEKRTHHNKLRAWRRWSKSKLQTLLRCPKEFEYVYIHPPIITIAEHISKVFGKAIHRRLQMLFDKKGEPYKSKKQYVDAWTGYWFGTTLKVAYPLSEDGEDPIRWTSCSGRDGDEPGMFYGSGVKILSQFWDVNAHFRKPHPQTPLVEKKFTVPIAGLTLEGVIDRINPVPEGPPRAVEIVDYKTGFTPVTETDVWRDIQCTAYEYGVQRYRKLIFTPVKMTLQLLSRNEEIDVPLRRRFNFDNLGELLSIAATSVQNMLAPESIQARDFFRLLNRWNVETTSRSFPATPGRHCNYCDFKNICPFQNPNENQENTLLNMIMSRDLVIPQYQEEPAQYELGLEFRFKKDAKRRRQDTEFEKHKRDASKGKTQLSMNLK